MRTQTLEWAKLATTSLRYVMVARVQVPGRRVWERLPTAWAYLIQLLVLPIYWCVGVYVCVHCAFALARHESFTDFESDGICGGPWFTPPSAFFCLRRKPFWVLGAARSTCTNCHERHLQYKHVPGWYYLVTRAIYESTVYMYGYIWYVQLPEVQM